MFLETFSFCVFVASNHATNRGFGVLVKRGFAKTNRKRKSFGCRAPCVCGGMGTEFVVVFSACSFQSKTKRYLCYRFDVLYASTGYLSYPSVNLNG